MDGFHLQFNAGLINGFLCLKTKLFIQKFKTVFRCPNNMVAVKKKYLKPQNAPKMQGKTAQ